MAREPSYPNEASVGANPAETHKAEAPASTPTPAAPDPKRKKQFVTGAAIGIGSAAIVAALLYANKGRKGGDKG
jgi:hypothetical protein